MDKKLLLQRRELIGLLGSAAAAWPLAAWAQRSEKMPLVGVLMNLAADYSEAQVRITAFRRGLEQAGWSDGHNVRIDIRWSGSTADHIREYATQLVALKPNVILAPGSATLAPLLQATHSVPIVFVHVPDPVGSGFVDSLARPGGNATGFSLSDYSTSGKWLELLKEIAPGIKRAAVIRDSDISAGVGQFGAIQAVAGSLAIEVVPVNIRDAGEIERGLATFAGGGNGGLILTGSALSGLHRDLIIALAARYRLPAVYIDRNFVVAGGLISYGPSIVDQFTRAAAYVDRILKGELPANLPVQTPVQYELAINLTTAKALGITVPPSILARADETLQ